MCIRDSFKIRFNTTHIVGLELTKENKHIEGVVLSNLSYIAIKRVFLAKNGKIVTSLKGIFW